MFQVREPSLDPYIYQPDGKGGQYVLTDWWGYCMAYVQSSYGTGWAGSSAWESWTSRTAFMHEDRNIPSGVYVPLWFEHWGDYDGEGVKNWGHVVIYKDGHIWSSPLSHKPYADEYDSIEEVERRYGCSYVGWSEDVGGTRVVDRDPLPPQPTPQPLPPVVVPQPKPTVTPKPVVVPVVEPLPEPIPEKPVHIDVLPKNNEVKNSLLWIFGIAGSIVGLLLALINVK